MLANMDLVLTAYSENALSEPDQLTWLEQLDNWQIEVEKVGLPCRHLCKMFCFSDFQQALDFVNRVGQLAEAENHHPELRLSWGKVEVLWWTHAVKGLHLNDFIMAARTDLLVKEYFQSAN